VTAVDAVVDVVVVPLGKSSSYFIRAVRLTLQWWRSPNWRYRPSSRQQDDLRLNVPPSFRQRPRHLAIHISHHYTHNIQASKSSHEHTLLYESASKINSLVDYPWQHAKKPKQHNCVCIDHCWNYGLLASVSCCCLLLKLKLDLLVHCTTLMLLTIIHDQTVENC